MAFKLAEAYVEFSQKGVQAVKSSVASVKSSVDATGKSINSLRAGFAALGGFIVLGTLRSIADAAAEASKQTAKLEAVLASTGGVSGQTLQALEAHASALQKVTAFEDDTIKGAQAVLLTFKKIAGETFPQATEAALDLATVFEGDLRGSAMMVGKALEDPIRGITALRRAGVSFTKDQQEVIKSLVETGRVAEAQAMILKELNSQVGGSARKVGDTTFGQIEQFKNAIGDLAEEIGGAMTPAIKAATAALRTLTAGSVPLSPGVRAENRAKASAEFAEMARQLMGAESQTEARKVMARINTFMSDVALRGVDPAQFAFTRDKLFRSMGSRMRALPEFTADQLEGQRADAARAADDRYRASQEKVQRDLRMQTNARAVGEWESLKNVDLSALGRAADLQRDSVRLQKEQADRLTEIRDKLSYEELLRAMAARYH